MDIDTFKKLRKDSILELTPSEVKGLLGKNLRDLKAQEDKPPVKDWRLRQKQSELKRLGFGVRGGRPEGYMNIKPRNNN
ncbi:PREDICTED: mesothelin-like [Gekko japonicus]|uniref:Mesothelin-like n=1 Tax=Gekko japonicus TaxID=146911 RepID=A0ABM1L0T7_GEKJA|nr:PREDICTED: mesothelin-like [Gekko japonicus]